MKTKFLSVCLGISLVLFSLTFFIRSFTPAMAQSNMNHNNNSTTGKYQVAVSMGVTNDGGLSYIAIILDTETGRSKTFTIKWGDSEWHQKWDLPDQ